MADKLRVIRPTDAGPVPEVVEICRELLAMAEAGEVVGVAIATTNNERITSTRYEIGEGTVADLHYSTSWLARRIMDFGCEGAE